MPPRFFKAIKVGRTCSNSSDNRLILATKPISFLQTNLPFTMSSTLFNSASFRYTLTFIERLLQKEDNVFDLIDLCHDDPTLSLNLHIILEAIEMEKLLEDSLGCNNDATLNLHTIITTSIADVIRDSDKFFVPDFIHTRFAGRGIINYFKKFSAHIHSYGTGGKCPTYQPYPKRRPSSSDSSTSPVRGRCSKCKKVGHFRRNCSNYFCQGCYSWGPGHTLPNCPTTKAAKMAEQKEWDKFCDRNNDWGKREGAPWVPVNPQPTWTWTGVQVAPNEEWTKPQEVIDLTSPSPSPSAPPPSPLSSLPSLISEFGDSSSGYASSLLLELADVGDIEN